MITVDTYEPELVSTYAALHAKSILSSWEEETGHKKLCLFQSPGGTDLFLIVVKDGTAMRVGLSLDQISDLMFEAIEKTVANRCKRGK